MTYRELVLEYFPEASDKEIEHILWECTAFPFCGIETLREQLQNESVRPDIVKEKPDARVQR